MTATNIFYNFVGFRYSPPLFKSYLRANRALMRWDRKYHITVHAEYGVIYMHRTYITRSVEMIILENKPWQSLD